MLKSSEQFMSYKRKISNKLGDINKGNKTNLIFY